MGTYSILAIHGLGAHPDDTWRQRNGVNWLEDDNMLPEAMPDARIMRFGYYSQWFGTESISRNVGDIASRLLEELLNNVCIPVEASRSS